MNRRGFFGLIGKLVAVAASMGVSPMLTAPLKTFLGATIYVKPGQSINEAISRLPVDGGTIILLAGIHKSEPFSIPAHIDSRATISIRGVGPKTIFEPV
jgi:hypothetical protein